MCKDCGANDASIALTELSDSVALIEHANIVDKNLVVVDDNVCLRNIVNLNSKSKKTQ